MILYSVLIGLFAVVYRQILAYEPILNWWFKFGSRYESRFFYKPIWGCELCISGQVALWLYLLTSLGGYLIEEGFTTARLYLFYLLPWNFYVACGGNVFTGVIFITTTIAAAFLWGKVFKHIN